MPKRSQKGCESHNKPSSQNRRVRDLPSISLRMPSGPSFMPSVPSSSHSLPSRFAPNKLFVLEIMASSFGNGMHYTETSEILLFPVWKEAWSDIYIALGLDLIYASLEVCWLFSDTLPTRKALVTTEKSLVSPENPTSCKLLTEFCCLLSWREMQIHQTGAKHCNYPGS